MAQICENSYFVNSFHAIDGDTKQVIAASGNGSISLSAGQTVIFESLYTPGEYVHLNTLVIKAVDGDVKVNLNDNDLYPFYVPDGEQKGIQYMAISSFTAVSACELYYEGLVA